MTRHSRIHGFFSALSGESPSVRIEFVDERALGVIHDSASVAQPRGPYRRRDVGPGRPRITSRSKWASRALKSRLRGLWHGLHDVGGAVSLFNIAKGWQPAFADDCEHLFSLSVSPQFAATTADSARPPARPAAPPARRTRRSPCPPALQQRPAAPSAPHYRPATS